MPLVRKSVASSRRRSELAQSKVLIGRLRELSLINDAEVDVV
jgi:hypothetical protein